MRLPLNRHFGLAFTPATGAAALVVGAVWLWRIRRAEEAARHNYKHAGKDYKIDAQYRKLDLRSLSDQQIRWLHEVVDETRDEYYRDPLRGWTVTRWELQRETLRRSGGGGLIFIPPVVALPSAAAVGALAQAARLALIGGAAYLIAKLGLSNWGQINSKNTARFGPPVTVPLWWPEGFMSPTGQNVFTYSWIIRGYIPSQGCQTYEQVSSAQTTVTGLASVSVFEGDSTGLVGFCGNLQAPFQVIRFTETASGTAYTSNLNTQQDTYQAAYIGTTVAPAGPEPSPVPYPEWQPLPRPAVRPIAPQPMPSRAPGAVPQPGTLPEPQTPPGGTPAAPPAVAPPGTAPRNPPTFRPNRLPPPVQLPGGQEIQQDGKQGQPQQSSAPVKQTKPGSHVVGSAVIPQQGPRPQLTSIAKELGRLENKTANLLRTGPQNGGQGPGDLLGLVQQVVQALAGLNDSGTYTLGGSCERDEQGNPIPFEETLQEWQWGGSPFILQNLAQRLDAIAEMLQTAQLLRQPSCKNPSPMGQMVSVQFREIESGGGGGAG